MESIHALCLSLCLCVCVCVCRQKRHMHYLQQQATKGGVVGLVWLFFQVCLDATVCDQNNHSSFLPSACNLQPFVCKDCFLTWCTAFVRCTEQMVRTHVIPFQPTWNVANDIMYLPQKKKSNHHRLRITPSSHHHPPQTKPQWKKKKNESNNWRI